MLGAALTAALITYLASLDSFQVGTYRDDARYIVAARALATGNGYSLASFPDPPPPETQYPPGYPALLAPLTLIYPNWLAALRVPSLVFTLASLPLWFLLLRRRLPWPASCVILCAVALNPLVVGHATLVMSEAAFFFVLPLLFLLADDLRDSRTATSKSLAVGILLVALYFIRTLGLVFAVTTVAYLLAVRRFRSAFIVTTIFAVPFFAWSYRTALLGGGYPIDLDQASDSSRPGGLPGRLVTNGASYATDALPSALALDSSGSTAGAILELLNLGWIPPFIGIALTGLFGVGLVVRLRASPGLAEVCVPFYAAFLVLWYWPITRYLHPMVPLIYLFLYEGLRWLLAQAGGPSWNSRGHRMAMGAIGILVLVNVVRIAQGLRDPVRNRMPDLTVGASWIAQNTPNGSIVMSDYPIQRHLYTERLMVETPPVAAAARGRSLEAIRASGADYVLIAPRLRAPRTTELRPAARELERAISERPPDFRIVFSSPEENVRVYAVRRE